MLVRKGVAKYPKTIEQRKEERSLNAKRGINARQRQVRIYLKEHKTPHEIAVILGVRTSVIVSDIHKLNEEDLGIYKADSVGRKQRELVELDIMEAVAIREFDKNLAEYDRCITEAATAPVRRPRQKKPSKPAEGEEVEDTPEPMVLTRSELISMANTFLLMALKWFAQRIEIKKLRGTWQQFPEDDSKFVSSLIDNRSVVNIIVNGHMENYTDKLRTLFHRGD